MIATSHVQAGCFFSASYITVSVSFAKKTIYG
nr:MAG TPA: hypothetical protein [Caudoviricetes sp.]DAN04283.1 MAG TPA: hypothetical protein [Caudoviricetes sp.]